MKTKNYDSKTATADQLIQALGVVASTDAAFAKCLNAALKKAVPKISEGNFVKLGLNYNTMRSTVARLKSLRSFLADNKPVAAKKKKAPKAPKVASVIKSGKIALPCIDSNVNRVMKVTALVDLQKRRPAVAVLFADESVNCKDCAEKRDAKVATHWVNRRSQLVCTECGCETWERKNKKAPAAPRAKREKVAKKVPHCKILKVLTGPARQKVLETEMLATQSGLGFEVDSTGHDPEKGGQLIIRFRNTSVTALNHERGALFGHAVITDTRKASGARRDSAKVELLYNDEDKLRVVSQKDFRSIVHHEVEFVADARGKREVR